ncbi:LysM peptidoglycan-binding domain-containing protein [Nocardioides sp. zg-DK7169]|uniref:LysM peptidoglycan-binding domain-containing protein n=1 Tax=Nocardioides sp. zg-DK7169 TaxID=2736600 RepID=UPI00155453A0|nr:LysM peptidoglycan-binding domain-containing protein [Nocardioides sp. zg-DK7169]NPC97436.1 LysM peptidoglycan-binding domain-containing protein [Nocardioides sp. zg-DK7169]
MSTLNPTTSLSQPSATAGAVRGSLRLTRRGRVAVFVLSVAILLGIGFALAGGSMATAEKGEAEPTEIITVGTGQTLWDIASEVGDSGDVRDAMRHIEKINALDSTMLVAGQRLAVPIG